MYEYKPPRCPKCKSGAVQCRLRLIGRKPVRVFKCFNCKNEFSPDEAYAYLKEKKDNDKTRNN